MGIIATPLGWIMKGCYFVCKNYGIAPAAFHYPYKTYSISA